MNSSKEAKFEIPEEFFNKKNLKKHPSLHLIDVCELEKKLISISKESIFCRGNQIKKRLFIIKI